MTIGLRQLLLLAATVVFIVAIFINSFSGWANWISVGLACAVGALLIGEMGWDRPLGTRAPRRHE